MKSKLKSLIAFAALIALAISTAILAAPTTNAPFVLDLSAPSTANGRSGVTVNSNGVVVSPTNVTFIGDVGVSSNLSVTGSSEVYQSETIHGNLHVGAAIYVSPPGFIGTMFGNANGLTNIQLKISGTNATPPADTNAIKSWVNVTLPNGSVFKTPLYQ